MASDYTGPDRRSESKSLSEIKDVVGRLETYLESDTKFRDWVHEKFHDIKDTLFGNGKKGLVRDMDQVQSDLKHLGEDIAEMKDLVKKVQAWALVSSLSALGLIAFEVVMIVLKKGHP